VFYTQQRRVTYSELLGQVKNEISKGGLGPVARSSGEGEVNTSRFSGEGNHKYRKLGDMSL